jgi:hypothetical protein
MSDQNPKPIAFQQGGNPVPASPTPEPGMQTVQPSSLTQDQVRAIAEEVAEAKFRQTQGLIDKADSRITKKVQGELQQLEKTLKVQAELGIVIPPEKVIAMQQQVMARAYSENEQPPAPTQPYGTQPTQPMYPEGGNVPDVSAQALRMMQRAGVIIEDSDPEVVGIDMSDPDLFLASVGHAINVKKTRLAAPVTPTNAGGSGSPQGLQAQYQAELKAVAGKPVAVGQLKMKYRRLGLDVW